MHMCVSESVRLPFLFLHHLCPKNLQWSWLACPQGDPAQTQTLVLPVLLLPNPCRTNGCCWTMWGIPFHKGHGFNTNAWKIARQQGLYKFVVLKAKGRSILTAHSDRIYIYINVGLARTIYIRCIYGIFGREIIKYTVIYGVYIRFWPTLYIRIYAYYMA